MVLTIVFLGWFGLAIPYEGIASGRHLLPDKNGELYTVTREEPTSAHVSLGFLKPLSGGDSAEGGGISEGAHVFASQMGTTQCDKTSCLNAFNTSFMPSLAYKMIATQFTEQQWNKMISPAIQATLNAAGVVRNLAHAVLYGPDKYQGLAVQNPFFLQQIIHITALMTEAVCNSSTGKLLRYSAENFRVEIGIPFSLTSTPYDEKRLQLTVLHAGTNLCGDLCQSQYTGSIYVRIIQTSSHSG